MNELLNRRPRLAILFINLALLAIGLAIVEIGLRVFAPYQVATIGHREAPNAKRYGWGFGPGETIRIRDPDTGKVYVDKANSRGWRDREHTIENPDNRFRIGIPTRIQLSPKWMAGSASRILSMA